jgi:hypothetical protein
LVLAITLRVLPPPLFYREVVECLSGISSAEGLSPAAIKSSPCWCWALNVPLLLQLPATLIVVALVPARVGGAIDLHAGEGGVADIEGACLNPK